MTFFEVQ